MTCGSDPSQPHHSVSQSCEKPPDLLRLTEMLLARGKRHIAC